MSTYSLLLFLLINLSAIALFGFFFLIIDLAVYLKIFIIRKIDSKRFILSLYKNIPIKNSQIKYDVFQITVLSLVLYTGLIFGVNSFFELNQHVYSFLVLSILPIIVFMTIMAPLDKLNGIAQPDLGFGKKFLSLLVRPVIRPKGILLLWDQASTFGKIYKLNILFLKYAFLPLPIFFLIYILWMVLPIQIRY